MLLKSAAELARLEALQRYQVLDTAPEESFDRISRIAQSILQVPISLISLIDENRQWFKSRQGLDVCETDRKISFCTYAIQRNEPLIIADAWADDRFKSNPLVTGAPFIRFYIGAPLRTYDGQNIGTICAIDREPRAPSLEQITTLSDLSRLVVDQLELRRIAMTDSLTGAMTRHGFVPIANAEFLRSRRHGRDLSIIMMDIDHFKSINDQYGHAAGDVVLQDISAACRDVLRVNDHFTRLGGEEFAILLPETPLNEAVTAARRVQDRIRANVSAYDNEAIKVTCSFGVTTLTAKDDDVASLSARADLALYQAKRQGRDQVVTLPPPL